MGLFQPFLRFYDAELNELVNRAIGEVNVSTLLEILPRLGTAPPSSEARNMRFQPFLRFYYWDFTTKKLVVVVSFNPS